MPRKREPGRNAAKRAAAHGLHATEPGRKALEADARRAIAIAEQKGYAFTLREPGTSGDVPFPCPICSDRARTVIDDVHEHAEAADALLARMRDESAHAPYAVPVWCARCARASLIFESPKAGTIEASVGPNGVWIRSVHLVEARRR